jgi:hypothetical protein
MTTKEEGHQEMDGWVCELALPSLLNLALVSALDLRLFMYIAISYSRLLSVSGNVVHG